MCVKFMSVSLGTFTFLCIVMFEQFKLYELREREREGQTDRHRETDRQTDRQRQSRQTDRETVRQTDREILPASSVRFLFSALSWADCLSMFLWL